MAHSQTVENYLKAIYKLSLNGKQAVTTNEIAERMHIRAATVSDMIKKLHQKNLVNHARYTGVTITPKGIKHAISIIRKHRLWEAFLVQTLGFKWDEVHEMAEQLEHVESDELINRLDKFLGFPKSDPHGDPIPDAGGNFKIKSSKTLSQLNAGEHGTLAGVINHSSVFLRHLDKYKLNLGIEVEVIEKDDFDNSMTIKSGNKKNIQISNDVASNLLIK